MHAYWSKKPHDAIDEYIKHHTEPGDIVLDPFCGSGGTVLMALANGRKGMGIDLSPVAIFISRYYCIPPDLEEFKKAYNKLVTKVIPEITWLYETKCERCEGKTSIAYTVYSSVFRCKGCSNDIPLFDCITKEVINSTGRPKKIKICPVCLSKGHIQEISGRTHEKIDVLPVETSYICTNSCKPVRATRRYNDPDIKRQKYFHEYDLRKIQEVEEQDIPFWYPKNRMMNIPDGQRRWGVLWRAGTANFEYVSELFTKRNLWAISSLFNAAGSNDDLKWLVNSAIMALSKKAQHLKGGRGIYPWSLLYTPANEGKKCALIIIKYSF